MISRTERLMFPDLLAIRRYAERKTAAAVASGKSFRLKAPGELPSRPVTGKAIADTYASFVGWYPHVGRRGGIILLPA